MPTPTDVLTVARGKLGLGESPPGSNHNLVTEWYGADGPWCAMFVSWVLAHSGFSGDGGKTLRVPGVVQTTVHGWSYVPYLLANFRNANRTTVDPNPGVVVTYDWDGDGVPDHTGILESLAGDGTFYAIEGNRNDEVERVLRNRSVVEAFCTLPYDSASLPAPIPPVAPGVPKFPGYCFLGSQDNATREVQQRLVDRGWHLQVDGIFGPVTQNIVKQFQEQVGIEVDGIVGPQTWAALWQAPITP
jgi:hypothetical protein